MLGQARAEAAREREELRADLRARAERAEQQADAYRDELGHLRAASHDAHRKRQQPSPSRPRGAQPAAPRPPETSHLQAGPTRKEPGT